MKLREYKRILVFLRKLESLFETQEQKSLTSELIHHYTNSELREMIHWIHRDVWSKNALGFMEGSKLIELINDDSVLLLWTIHCIEKRMTNTPSYSIQEVDSFFQKTQNQMHYLASKPTDTWDEYDLSNYRSLLVKTGTSKRVFGIFTSDVLAEDVYAVTTKPSYFFDTKEEAETEIKNIVTKGRFTSRR
jgi:hypothetical protein